MLFGIFSYLIPMVIISTYNFLHFRSDGGGASLTSLPTGRGGGGGGGFDPPVLFELVPGFGFLLSPDIKLSIIWRY